MGVHFDGPVTVHADNVDDLGNFEPTSAKQISLIQRILRAIKAIFCCCCCVPERDAGDPLVWGRFSGLPYPGNAGAFSPTGDQPQPYLSPYEVQFQPQFHPQVQAYPPSQVGQCFSYSSPDDSFAAPIVTADSSPYDIFAEPIVTADPVVTAAPVVTERNVTDPGLGEYIDVTILENDYNFLTSEAPRQEAPRQNELSGVESALLELPPAPAAAAAPTVNSVDRLQLCVLSYSKDKEWSDSSWFIRDFTDFPETGRDYFNRKRAIDQYVSIVNVVNTELMGQCQFDPKMNGNIPIRGRDGQKIFSYSREPGQELACVAIHALSRFEHLNQTIGNKASYLLAVLSFRVAVWPLLNVLVADYKKGTNVVEQVQQDAAHCRIIVPVQQYLIQHSANRTFLDREDAQIAEELLENVLMPPFFNQQGELQYIL